MPSDKTTNAINHVDAISALLWELDPMRTGCTGDATMRDEYDFQAEEIASLIDTGIPLRTAVVQVFDKWFWEDCLISGASSSRVDAIVEKISKINR